MLVQKCADSYIRSGVFSEKEFLNGIFVEVFYPQFSFLQNAIHSSFLVSRIFCVFLSLKTASRKTVNSIEQNTRVFAELMSKNFKSGVV
jgi:hypothetical protein